MLGAEGDLSKEIPDERHETLTLEVGQATEIKLREGSRIQISRKGIVDAQLLPGKLRLVGLKQGLVVLTLTHMGSEQEDYRYFVQVDKPLTPSASSSLLSEACQQAGLSFSTDAMTVAGVSGKARDFYRAKHLCEEQKDCLFRADLSEDGQKEIHRRLLVLFGDKAEVLVRENGALLVLIPCHEKEGGKEQTRILEHLIRDEPFKHYSVIACKNHWHHGRFTLYAKMIVMQTSAAKDLGLQTQFEGGGELGRGPLIQHGQLDIQIGAALQNRKAELVGEPVLSLLSGVEARAQSGSELLIMKEKGKLGEQVQTSFWKEVGMDLRVKVFPQNRETIRLQYSFLISSPSTKESGQIHMHKLESEVEMKLRQSEIVGSIQFKSSGEQNSSIPVVESIPIVGPLLQRSGTHNADSRIFLHFHITD